MSDKNLYDQDLYAWAIKNAEFARQHNIQELDLKHIAEELEDMGKNLKRELESLKEKLKTDEYKNAFKPWAKKDLITELVCPFTHLSFLQFSVS